MLIDQIMHIEIFFEIARENDKKRIKKEKCISRVWIQAIVVRLLDFKKASKTTQLLRYMLEQITYISVTCARQIKIARLLGLHYIARPLGLHYNHHVSLAPPLVSTIINI